MKKILTTLALLTTPLFANAQDLEYTGGYQQNQTSEGYLEKSNYKYSRSIIYVFSSDDPCHNCTKAVSMLEDVYNKYYRGKYDIYKVNYREEDLDYNYIGTYKLSRPLEVVLAKVEDGHADGYEKIEFLENKVSNKNGFEREVRNKIDRFLKR